MNKYQVTFTPSQVKFYSLLNIATHRTGTPFKEEETIIANIYEGVSIEEERMGSTYEAPEEHHHVDLFLLQDNKLTKFFLTRKHCNTPQASKRSDMYINPLYDVDWFYDAFLSIAKILIHQYIYKYNIIILQEGKYIAQYEMKDDIRDILLDS